MLTEKENLVRWLVTQSLASTSLIEKRRYMSLLKKLLMLQQDLRSTEEDDAMKKPRIEIIRNTNRRLL